MNGSTVAPARAHQSEWTGRGASLVAAHHAALGLLAEARHSIDAGDWSAARQHVAWAQDLVAQLKSSVDVHAGCAAQALSDLYAFMQGRLAEATVVRGRTPLDDVAALLLDLVQIWQNATTADLASVGVRPGGRADDAA